MLEHDLTLEELSQRTAIEPRTLRSWVSEGLLAPPLKAGRGARYPAGNVSRALAVRALKDHHGLSLSEIGRRFMMATEEQIRSWAQEAGPSATNRGSARDYLSTLRSQSAEGGAGAPSFSTARPERSADLPPRQAVASTGPMMNAPHAARQDEPNADLAHIEQLILQLERLVGEAAPRRARGMVWTRISITPDLELSVRGDLVPAERVLFEQLADQLRTILLGRARYE